MKILVFGDSISDGYWDMKKGGWGQRIRLNFWKKYGYENAVYDFGISGDTSREVNTNFTAFFKAICKRPQSQHDALCIFMIGLNDSSKLKDSGKHMISPEEFISNLEKLSLKLKRETQVKDVLFISNINVWEDKCNADVSHGYYYNEDIEAYNLILKEFAEKKNYKFLDIFGSMKQNHLKIDGLHPNAAGHKKLAKIIQNYLETHIIHK